MTASYSPIPLAVSIDAYEEFWHAAEDDVAVSRFDAVYPDAGPDADDVYATYVESIEA